MDTRMQQQLRKDKNAEKNLIKREQKKAYQFLIFFMVAGCVNYIFWNDQFLYLDSKHTIFFIVLPWILGLYVYYRMNKHFNKSVIKIKPTGLMDVILSNAFMGLIALFFSFISFVTLADGVFKLAMDFAVSDKPIITKTYIVKYTTRNDRGKGIHIFSYVHYRNENNEIKIFDVPVKSVESSNEKRKITFECKEGFWGYYKIVDYSISHLD